MTFSRHTPPLWSPRGGGGAELPPGLKLTEDTTSHKEGWLGTEEGWLGTEEGWLGTEEGWLGTVNYKYALTTLKGTSVK